MSAPIFSLDEQKAMAAAVFPAEWADAETLTGKRRSRTFRKLRDRAVYAAGLAALPEGACCGTCQHRDPPAHGLGSSCALDSDSRGYAIVKADDRCPRWERRT